MEVFIGIPETIVNHGVDKLAIAETVARARLRQQIWAVGHGLHSASHYYLGFAELHGLRSQCDRFQPRAAYFVDSHGGNPGIAAAFERRLTSGILAEPCLNDVAEDGFVNLLRIQ